MSDKDYFKRALTFPVFDKIAFSARRKIFDIFISSTSPKTEESILDIGVFAGSEDPNQNFLEYLYKDPSRITAVGIDDASFLERQYPGLKFIKIESGKALPFRDDQFDIAFSSAVIEHVGSRRQQEFFILEALRVSKRLFLTTPNKFYPVEFHTRLPLVHWLPQKFFAAVLKKIGLTFYSNESNLNLLSKKDLLALLPDRYRSKAELISFRLFGITSNLILIIKK